METNLKGDLEERPDSFVLHIRHVKFAWAIGLGYWKDIYEKPFNGYTHNFIVPFLRIQIGKLIVTKD